MASRAGGEALQWTTSRAAALQPATENLWWRCSRPTRRASACNEVRRPTANSRRGHRPGRMARPRRASSCAAEPLAAALRDLDRTPISRRSNRTSASPDAADPWRPGPYQDRAAMCLESLVDHAHHVEALGRPPPSIPRRGASRPRASTIVASNLAGSAVSIAIIGVRISRCLTAIFRPSAVCGSITTP